jgi:myosin protein heavy chain
MHRCAGFREKNKDALHPDLSGVMQASSLGFVRGLFPAEVASAVAASGGGGKKKKSADRMTVASQFMTQLASLMKTINETDVHYVRCLPPNGTPHSLLNGTPPLTPHRDPTLTPHRTPPLTQVCFRRGQAVCHLAAAYGLDLT